MIGKTTTLLHLEGGHCPVEFLIRPYEFGLGLHIHVHVLRINLDRVLVYSRQLSVVSEGALKIKISLIPPSMRVAIASLIIAHIVVPSRSITDIMDKLIRPASLILIGMPSILRMGEGEIALAGRLELDEPVDAVLC